MNPLLEKTQTKAKKEAFFEKILIILLILIPFLLFFKVQSFEFVNWDDDEYVYLNHSIRSFDWANWKIWFTQPYVKSYVPMTMASYALDYFFYGYSPSGFHSTNLFLHLLNILLVFAVLKRVWGDSFLAFGAALLFGIHPVQVEAVSWIAERKNLLYSFFFLCGFYLFTANKESKNIRMAALVVILFVFSLLSKITAFMIPFVCFAYHYFSSDKKTFWRLGHSLVTLTFGCVIAAGTLRLYPGLLRYFSEFDLSSFLMNQGNAYLRYVKSAVMPLDLNLFYKHIELLGASDWTHFLWVGVGGVLLAAFIMTWILKRKSGFWIAWFFIWMMPFITIFPVPVADRHLYLPVIGLIGFFITVLARYRTLAMAVLLLLNLIMIPLASARMEVWRNGETLWLHVLEAAPDDYEARMSLGNYYRMKSRNQEALEQFREAIRIREDLTYAYENIVRTCLAIGDQDCLEDMISVFEDKQWLSRLPSARAALALLQGDRDRAMRRALFAVRNGSKNPSDFLLAAKLLNEFGEFERESIIYKAALKRKIPSPELRFHYGVFLMKQSDWSEAIKVFNDMIDEGMTYPGIFYQLGYAYLKMDHHEQARQNYVKSTRIDPQHHTAHYHLGLMAYQEQDYKKAFEWFSRAAEKRPTSEEYQSMMSESMKRLKQESP